ncbi:MAG: helix-turn-helix transcriptional regulator [Pseudonocardiales bacterium]|nr:helix-turn-helix transcriptional regulator [Pseudonocardiales bacterium]MBV9032506.1 helix-turn-helix transcriptional regulator [Pseudonocardiales bacterium]
MLSVDSEEASAIGARARMIRRRRGLSLDVVAGLAGITKQYLSALELGQRGFNRRGLIEDLANALGCSVADLTGQPYLLADRASADASVALPEIGMVLSDVTLDDVPDVPARPVKELSRLVDLANDHSDQTHYAFSGRDLGILLTELQVHVVTGDTETCQMALATLVEACRVAFATAKNVGQPTIAVLAGRRGYDAAQRLGDPALIGFSAWYRSIALMRHGTRDRASQLLTASIDTLAGQADPTAPDPSTAEAYGLLHLCAALNAARAHRAADARYHLGEAKKIADRTGERNTMRLHFGPTNVAVWSIGIGAELDDGPAAYDRATAHPINVEALGSVNRVATLHFDFARALAQAQGARDAEAIRHLDRADRIAPVLIRNDPVARSVLADLDRRAKRRVWELDSLLNRFGISGHGQRSVDN